MLHYLSSKFQTHKELQMAKKRRRRNRAQGLVQVDYDTQRVIETILKIPGQKIVTLTVNDAFPRTFVIDVDEAGNFGYDPAAKAVFLAKLVAAFSMGGGLVIRQFLSDTIEVMRNGQRRRIPKKVIYGIALGEGSWQPLPAQEVEWACCTDNTTGLPIPPEEGVTYRDCGDVSKTPGKLGIDCKSEL
jgi:hypothetical protein